MGVEKYCYVSILAQGLKIVWDASRPSPSLPLLPFLPSPSHPLPENECACLLSE